MMLTLLTLTEIFMFGVEVPGQTLDRSSDHKAQQDQQVQRDQQDQLDQLVQLVHLLQSQQLLQQLLLQEMRGLILTLEKFIFTTIHFG
jgi:uncharacterized protein YjgD (DUF1641 family)